MISGAKIIYRKLLQHKVKDVFLYSGGAIMPLVDCFYDKKINYYINSNEHNGCNAAVGYAKSSKKPGVMIVTSGPGLTNCVTSMLDSTNDSTPLIVLSGQVSISSMGTCAFQECPATEITKSVTKWSYCVKDIMELPHIIDKAFEVATTGKMGTVHIDLPKDILSDKISLELLDKLQLNNYLLKDSSKTEYNYINTDKNISGETVFNEITKKINNAKSPLFFIGQGCNHVSKELTELVDKTNIPITTTMHAMGVYDETSQLSLKMCGMHGSYYSNMALQNADCIIGIGARFDDRTTGLISKYASYAVKNNAIINCNIDKNEINKTVKSNYSVIMDSKHFISRLKNTINYKPRKKWLNQIKKWKTDHPFEYANCSDNSLKTQTVLSEINNQISNKKDIICTFGVGNHLMMGCQFIDWKNPNSIIASGSLGVMGCSIGYAIGSQIANPDKTVLSIDGDGSFNMTLTDLKTIKEYNLPIKIAIMNDSKLMMVNIWEKLFFNERYTATDNHYNPDYVALAESYGIKAIYCDSQEHLSNKVKEFLECDTSILCEFKVKGEECLPLVGPGKALDDMILYKDYKKQKVNLSNEIAPN